MKTKKAQHEKKSCKVETLCTPEQFESIKARAAQHSMSVSEFGLFTMMNSRIEASIGVKDRLLDDLNHLHLMYKQGMLNEHEFTAAKERIFKNT